MTFTLEFKSWRLSRSAGVVSATVLVITLEYGKLISCQKFIIFSGLKGTFFDVAFKNSLFSGFRTDYDVDQLFLTLYTSENWAALSLAQH